ncbi:MAG: GH3 family domain-containing protein [Bacteroidota bacterium]
MTELERTQRNVLHTLLNKDRGSPLHESLGLTSVSSYESFSHQCPVTDWNSYAPYIARLKAGERNIIGRDSVSRFAVSSGTTGAGKHIPIPDRRLASDRKFMQSIVRQMISDLGIKAVNLLGGHHLSVPGTLGRQQTEGHSHLIGEITAHLADIAPRWSQFKQLIPPKQLIKLSMQEKMEVIIQQAASADVRLITAAPCWLPTLFKSIMQATGKPSISQCWPNLRVIIAGGMKVSPYLNELRMLWENSATFPLIVETYGASEGYFGFTSQTGSQSIKLITDQNIFFEGIPEGKSEPVPCWDFKPGYVYDLIITSNSGLWRYRLGDRIRCQTSTPLSITIEGRNEVFFDRYGEAVSLREVEEIIANSLISDFSYRQLSGTYIQDAFPYHKWLVLTDSSCSINTEPIQKQLDKQLMRQNRHYKMRREIDVLAPPVIKCLTYSEALVRYSEHLKPQQGLPLKF